MPAKSASQQKAAGAALSAKRGETPKGKLKGASRSMAEFDERGRARAHGVDQAQGQAGARRQGRLRSVVRRAPPLPALPPMIGAVG